MAALSTVGSIASSAAQASAAEDVQKKQNDANNAWVTYQMNAQRNAQMAEDAARSRADAARQDTLAKMTPESQQQTQAAEASRLNTMYQNTSETGTGRAAPGTNPATVAPYALTKEGTGTSGVGEQNPAFMSDLSSQINAATGQARSRIAGLATANSYGGSFGGLGRVDPITMQQGANEITLEAKRRDDIMKTLGVEQQVQPLHYALGANYGMMGQIGGALASVAGRSIGALGRGGFSGGADISGGNVGGSYDTGMGFTSDVPPADLGTAANPLPGLTAADYGY